MKHLDEEDESAGEEDERDPQIIWLERVEFALQNRDRARVPRLFQAAFLLVLFFFEVLKQRIEA